MFRKTITLISLLAILFFAVACGTQQEEELVPADVEPVGTLTLSQTSVGPGEEISVSFTASPNLAPDAWVGIIPSDVAHGSEAENDNYDLAYEYLNEATEGSFTFTAPSEPGSYDFRLHDTDNGEVGIELASVTFEVTP